MTSWLSSIKSLKREKEKLLTFIPRSYQKEKNFNIPLLRFPMILQHFGLEEFQAMHISESYSEDQLRLQ